MTAYPVIGCRLKQNANEGCNSCASLAGLVSSFVVCFIARFILLVIAALESAAAASEDTETAHIRWR